MSGSTRVEAGFLHGFGHSAAFRWIARFLIFAHLWWGGLIQASAQRTGSPPPAEAPISAQLFTHELAVGSYRLIHANPVSATATDFIYSARLRNSTGRPYEGARATLVDAGSADVIDGDLRFGSLPPLAQAGSADTFTVRTGNGEKPHIEDFLWAIAYDRQPVANAGFSQTVALHDQVHLDGSKSTDPNGDRLHFRWRIQAKPDGSRTELQGDTSVHPVLGIDQPGKYVVELVVDDGQLSSPASTVEFNTGNSPPVARGGRDQTVLKGSVVKLDGSTSSDVDSQPLRHHWEITRQPKGSKAKLDDPAAVQPRFTADRSGDYTVRLHVEDSEHEHDDCEVHVSTHDSLPVADAGPDQTVHLDDIVLLDGSGSTDVDGSELHYHWSFTTVPDGSLAQIADPSAVKTSFDADRLGAYVVQLTVGEDDDCWKSDEEDEEDDEHDHHKNGKHHGDSGNHDKSHRTSSARHHHGEHHHPRHRDHECASDTVVITSEDRKPIAAAGPDRTVPLNHPITLDGSHSGDPDGTPISDYLWSISTAPAGSLATLTGDASATPGFTADLPGTYVIQLIVKSDGLTSDPDTVVIQTENSKPVADAGPAQQVTQLDVVHLDGSHSSDADHDPLTYRWSLLKKPDGSAAEISPADGVNPSFIADLPGDYVVQLIVNDGTVDSDPATTTVVAVRLNHPPVITSTPVTTATAGTAYTYDVEGSDPDADPLTYSLDTAPAGMTIDPLSGVIQWTPSPSQVGDQSVTVRVTDGGGLFANQPYTIAVAIPVNHAPTAVDDSYEGIAGRTLTIAAPGVLGNDGDPDGNTLTALLVTPPSQGTVELGSDGSFVYTPHAPPPPPRSTDCLIDPTAPPGGVSGATIQTFVDLGIDAQSTCIENTLWIDPAGFRLGQFVRSDGAGAMGHITDTTTFGVYDLSSLDGSFAGNADGRDFYWVQNTGFGTDLGGGVVGAPPSKGLIWDLGGAANQAVIFVSVDHGPLPGEVLENTAWLSNDPNAPDGGWTQARLEHVYLQGWSPDPDVADGFVAVYRLPSHQTFRYVSVTWGGPGAVLRDGDNEIDAVGGLTESGFGVGDSFTYKAYDGQLDSNVATVHITFAAPVNHPPQITSTPVTLGAVGVNYDYTVTAIDPDTDLLAYSLDAAPSGMSINANTGTILWTPDASQGGGQNVTVRVTDPGGLSDTQSFTIAVATPNHPPVAQDDVYSASFGVAFTVPAPGVLGNDTDADGDALTTALVQGPTSGTLSLNADGGFTYTADPLPTPSAGLNVVLKWSWNGSTTLPTSLNVLNTPAVVDLDGDGTPDVVFGSTASTGGGAIEVGNLRALNGKTGAELFTVTARTVNVASSVAVGDIDGDGKPEIIASDSSGGSLLAFEHDGSFKWQSAATEAVKWGSPAIVDLDADGQPEIVIGRQVLNADGSLRWSGAAGSGLGISSVGGLPLASDLDLDGIPEIVAGNSAYSAGGQTLWQQVSAPDGYNAVGNFDADPYAEIVLVGSGTVRLLEHDGTVKWGPVAIPGGGYGGPPTVADFDGDGEAEIGVAGATRYVVIETDGTIKWQSTTQDGSSNVTGSSVFDFEGDGSAEVVYRDELKLRVYRGTDGTVLYETPMSSCTWYEYPLVADVDADNHAEIVVGANNNCGFGPQRGIYVFADQDNRWVPTRKIWNQHSYHITNVNEDGTIPKVEAVNWLIPGLNNFRLNTFSPSDTAVTDRFTYRANDGKADSNIATVTITARNVNHAPRFTSTPVTTATVGGTYTYAVAATDPDLGDVLTFALSTAPVGMTINSTTGSITWTPTAVQVGAHSVIVRVQDTSGLFVTQSFSITVTAANTNHAPAITSTPAATAQVGQPYTYPVTANDPDVGDILTYSLSTNPGNAAIDAASGVLTWTPLASQAGLQSIEVTVSDNHGGSVSQGFVVNVLAANLEPTITSAAPTSAIAGSPYTYPVVATDPNPADLLSYSLTQFPTGMSINSATGLIAWTPTDVQIGQADVVVQVVDQGGLAATQSFRITVASASVQVPNVVGESLTSAQGILDSAQLAVGFVLNVYDDVVAAGTVMSQQPLAGSSAAKGSAVDLTVSQGPAPVSVPDVVGLTQSVAVAQLVAAQLQVGTLTTSSSSTVPIGQVLSQVPAAGTSVAKGTSVALVLSSGPPAAPLAKLTIPAASPAVLVGESFALTAIGTNTDSTGQDMSSLVTWSSSDPAVATIDGSGMVTALAAGTVTITASEGTVSTSVQITVSASASGDTTPPSAILSGPDDGATVTAPAVVTGTATDANFLKYILDFAPAGETVFTTLASGTTAVTDGTLGNFDPTLLLNDIYTLRLRVFDQGGNISQASINVQVARDRKVGNFSIAFQDLNIPVAGIPITVTRAYDSRNKSSGDFGFGWSLDLQTIRIRAERNQGLAWQVNRSGGFFPTFSFTPLRSHKVSISLPDGKTEEFDMQPDPATSVLFPFTFLNGIQYVARSGTQGKLVALDQPDLLAQGSQPGVVELMDTTTFTTYDAPQSFQYTSPEGRVLTFQSGKLTSLVDTNGNSLTFGTNGILHSSGKGIVFVRDAQGRITQITDPNGNRHSYSYDGQGNLSSHTDPLGNITRFTYNFTHGLLEILDPLGRKAARNDYDDQGRLIRVTDASGNVIEVTHDLNANQEIVKDRLGNTTINEYDAAGNLVRTTDALGGVTLRTFDAQGNQLSETDPLGNVKTYTYDTHFNRLSETDGLGHITRYTYNAQNQLTSLQDALGHTTSNTYDAKGNLTSITDALGNTTANVYDAGGNLTQTTDPAGNTTGYEHDANGNLTQETDASGHATTYTYDANGNRLTETRTRTLANGTQESLVTHFDYDALNRLVKTTQPDGSVTRTVYNAIGKQAQTTDAQNRTTSYLYDDQGRLIKTTYPDGTFDSSSYDAESRRLTSTDRAGRITHYDYDQLGRQRKTTFPDSTSTSTAYDKAGQVESTTDAAGHVTRYVYDDAGRRTQVIDATNTDPAPACGTAGVTCFAYDEAGNQTQVTDANNHGMAFSYDAANRRTKVTYPDSTTDQTGYDALGRQTAKTDQAGVTTRFVYDKLGRLIQVIDARNTDPNPPCGIEGVTCYGYDELGQQISQTDANNHTTTLAYDNMGRRTGRTLPDGQSESMSYDIGGNLASKTDFSGKTTTFAYDIDNRLTTKTPDPSLGQPGISYTYTVTGQRATMLDASGQTSYSYDNRDRLTQKATPQGTLSYSYNAAGLLAGIQSGHANGVAISYQYDALNRLSQVTDQQQGGVTTTYAYDNVGNLQSYAYPNGVTHRYAYNSLNRLTDLKQSLNGTDQAGYSYTLGATGNRLSVSELGGRTVGYAYDSLYRLTRETIANDPHGIDGQVDYVYDPVGNRLSRTSTLAGIANQTFTYNKNDQLNTDSYDANGNTTASDGKTWAYDFENHLTAQNAGQVAIVYDGDGNRVSETVGGVTTEYLVDTLNPTGYAQVLEEIVNGEPVVVYGYGLDLISQNRKAGSSWAASYYGYDGHGSVRDLTDASGNITDSYDYEAFGNVINRAGSTENSYLYSGEQVDPNIGSYYLRARYFEQNLGRFLSRDAFSGSKYDPSTLHKYLYTPSDPVNHTDPSGQFFGGIGGVAMTMAIGGLVNVGLTIAFNLGNVSASELWGAFAVGAITAPVGGLLTKVFGPLLRGTLQPLFRSIGTMDRVVLTGSRTAMEKFLIKVSRVFVNTNRNYPRVGDTFLGKILQRAFPNVEWQMHHVYIQQAWSRLGSASQLYSDVLANEGLRRVGNGLWNLLPIPASLNNALGRTALGTQMLATFYYSIIVFTPYQIVEALDGESDE